MEVARIRLLVAQEIGSGAAFRTDFIQREEEEESNDTMDVQQADSEWLGVHFWLCFGVGMLHGSIETPDPAAEGTDKPVD